MSYMSRDERRTSIVNAAADIALRQGLAAATVRAVAKAIDASPGQIHHHFVSAAELRAEAFRMAIQRAAFPEIKQMKAMLPADQLLLVLLGDRQNDDPQIMALWNEAMIVARDDEAVKDAVRTSMEEWLALLIDIIREAQENGVFRKDAVADDVAGSLIAVSIGLEIMASVQLRGHASEDIRLKVAAIIAGELGVKA